MAGTNIFTAWNHITMYKNGVLVFGEEPIPETLNIDDSGEITLEFHNNNTPEFSNVIKGIYRIINNSSNIIHLSDIKLRYYYTKDKDILQNFYCDHASSENADGGNYTAFTSSVYGTFTNMSLTTALADTYLEIGFTSVYTNVPANGGQATITTRIARADWTDYNMLNDYSYLGYEHNAYYNVSGTYRESIPYYNVEGTPRESIAYYNVGGVWK